MRTKTFFTFLLFIIWYQNINAQDCTVNAGIDASYCFNKDNNDSVNTINLNLIQLYGNSAGNFNTNPNLLWEVVSKPIGANIFFANAASNANAIQASYNNIPTGVYQFRLGINCQTGGRIYDTVKITVTNVADFYLYANKKLSVLNVMDTIKFVGRPLMVGENLTVYGKGITILSSNVGMQIDTPLLGPTVDSVRFTCLFDTIATCSSIIPFLRYDFINNTCQNLNNKPVIDTFKTSIGGKDLIINGINPDAKDTAAIICASGKFSFLRSISSCISGDSAAFVNYNIGNNIIVNKLQGSGVVSVTFKANGVEFSLVNNWDTVTVNTYHVFEVTYNGNGNFTTFKDTLVYFFKSMPPSFSTFTFYNGTYNATVHDCKSTPFPIINYKYPLISVGIIPAQYKFTTILNTIVPGISLANPDKKDTLQLIGAIQPGVYNFFTTVTDTLTGCSRFYVSRLSISASTSLPVLQDTVVCKSSLGGNSFSYVFGNNTFGLLGNIQYEAITSDGAVAAIITDNSIIISILDNKFAGTVTVVVQPNTADFFPCNDGRKDTFLIEVLAGGYVSNAGTNQNLSCTINNTSLAGSDPVNSGGDAGFWTFLPSLSSNNGMPVIIADSANRTSFVSGFLNQGNYYFSWTVTDKNTGRYCNLQPDTVRIISSDKSPTIAQAAQADFSGCLPINNSYVLQSNAAVPTYDVLWTAISGTATTIQNAQTAAPTITGLGAGNYTFQQRVSNTCGVFLDTVALQFVVCSPLDLWLIDFTAQHIQNKDIITWQTSEEQQIYSYNLETSLDGKTFENIQTIVVSNPSATAKNYSVTNNASYPKRFYRLIITDNNNAKLVSKTIVLHNDIFQNSGVVISPNPASNRLYYSIFTNNKKNSYYTITDVYGKKILDNTVACVNGKNDVEIDISAIAAGMYYLNIDGEKQKFIIDK
jgi:Secretion system C-terminal sorting domain